MGCERGDVPANQIPRSARHRHSTRFGDVSPPVVKGVWSSRCAHRASFGYLLVTNETQLARAVVSPSSDLAPASHNAREHASSVALVVITSSSSRIRKLSTRPPFGTAKTPLTAFRTCAGSHSPDSTIRQAQDASAWAAEATFADPLRCKVRGAAVRLFRTLLDHDVGTPTRQELLDHSFCKESTKW